jgi:hypothetical protein
MKYPWRWLGLATVVVALAVWFWPPKHNTPISELALSLKAPAGSVSVDAISQTDLPPEGTRSLFDHLIAQNDGLPYPFDKLVKLIQDQNPDGALPVNVLIPNGRSLLKGVADFKHPRVLLAADFELDNKAGGLGLRPRGQLFLGFVENAHEIEVLSYNEAAGRFEFQLVQNYCAGCVPRIVYAQRAICTTCHQGGGPIFPQRPWSETNAQPAIADAIRAARGNDKPYLSLAISNALASPDRFDQLTDEGNFINVTQRVWLDGCGLNGIACRRTLLKLALLYRDSPGSFDPEQPLAKQLRQLQSINYPEQGIAVLESDLFNRDPLSESRGMKGWWHKLTTRESKMGLGAINNEDLDAFDRLPKLAHRLDPMSQRSPKQMLGANDIDGVYGLAALFSSSDINQLSKSVAYQRSGYLVKVDALPDAVFAAKPASRVALMRALMGREAQFCCLSTAEMSPPQASGIPPLAIEKHAVLNDFAEHCFACHRGNPSKRLNFMAGANEDDVLANIQHTSEIRDALDWERYAGTEKANKLMPPRDSIQYEELLGVGNTRQDALKRMREAVPNLFGF